MAAGIVPDLFVSIRRANSSKDILQLIVDIHGIFHGIIQVGDVSVVVLVVVDFHRHFVDVGFEGIRSKAECWKCKWA